MVVLPGERRDFILDRLRRNGRILAAEIAAQFAISEDSARRDLRELTEAGLCRRVYGGALPVSAPATSLATRETQDQARKAVLARATATLLVEIMPARGILFVDVGSTNAAIARALPAGLGVTIVTNAPSIAATLAGRPGLELLVIGGRVDPFVGAALGAKALRDVEGIRPDVALIGLCALDAEAGLCVLDGEDAALKRAIVAGASGVVAAATSEKLGARAPFVVAPAARLSHLVVEADAPEGEVAALKAQGICVHHVAAGASR